MKPARTFWRVGAGLLLLLSVCGLAAVFGRDRYRAMLASVDARALRTYTVVEARDADRGIQHDGCTAVIFAGLSDAEMARVIDRSAAWRVYTPDAPVSWLLYGGMHAGSGTDRCCRLRTSCPGDIIILWICRAARATAARRISPRFLAGSP